MALTLAEELKAERELNLAKNTPENLDADRKTELALDNTLDEDFFFLTIL